MSNTTDTKPFTRVRYVLASLFVIWHSLALVIGPAPGSYLMGQIYPLFKPYLHFFHLQNYWAFFAPDPASGRLLRYQVDDHAQRSEVFKLTETVARNDPAFFRYNTLFNSTTQAENEVLRESVIMHICRRHVERDPHSITLFYGYQDIVGHQDYRDGVRPLDDEFMGMVYDYPRSCRSN